MTDIARLPKWAQREIAKRDRRIAELEREVAALRVEPSALAPDWVEHVAVLDPYGNRLSIGDGHVEYAFPDFHGRRNLRVRYAHGRLEVMGDGALLIRPRSSNFAYLEPE